MNSYAYRIVNVFAEAPLEGNPLCVFEDGGGLGDATMQALALQFNLSETTFLLPSERATAHVRIFTPTFEMPFAGHPTLGSAHVVRSLKNAGDAVTLELRAGIIPVQAEGDVWTLEANPPKHRAPTATRGELAAMLSLNVSDLAAAHLDRSGRGRRTPLPSRPCSNKRSSHSRVRPRRRAGSRHASLLSDVGIVLTTTQPVTLRPARWRQQECRLSR